MKDIGQTSSSRLENGVEVVLRKFRSGSGEISTIALKIGTAHYIISKFGPWPLPGISRINRRHGWQYNPSGPGAGACWCGQAIIEL